MNVSTTQMTALQAVLMRDGELFDQLGMDDDVASSDGFTALTAAAFVLAARRRFSPGSPTADVIQLVGQLRARDHALYVDVSADVAEQMLLRILRGGDSECDSLDQGARAYAQIALLAELTRGLNGAQLDALLAEARDLADHWLEQDR